MSGECNWCGGPHAEGGCKADRELIYSNGMAAGYANGHNDRNEAFNALRTRLAACEEAAQVLANALALERYGDPADTGYRHIAEMSGCPMATKLVDEAKSAIEQALKEPTDGK